MKIVISALGDSLDSEVDPRFGRCQWFIIVDTETLQFEAVENSSSAASGGAGIAAAQMIAAKGVKAVLTGNCGPNAYKVLSSSGIQVITGVSGKVKDAIDAYRKGEYRASPRPNVSGHFGTRGVAGMGQRLTQGWQSEARPASGPASGPAGLQQELAALKSQSQLLAQQLADIEARIKKLEKGSQGEE